MQPGNSFIKNFFSLFDPQANKQRLSNIGAPGYGNLQPPTSGGSNLPIPPGGGDPMTTYAAQQQYNKEGNIVTRRPERGQDPMGYNIGVPVQDRIQRAQAKPGPRSGDMYVDRAQTRGRPNGLYDPRVAGQIIDQMVAEGYDPRFAAGMAANAMVESAGNPTAFNKAEGAFGLFQHRLDRLDNMREFANRVGMDVNDISTQVSFAMHEFMAGERAAYGQILGGDPQSAAQYARLIDKYWERSDGSARDKRAQLASQIYQDFFGGGAYTDREPLSYGTDIDPYGVQDNAALASSTNPADFQNFGDAPYQKMQDFFLGTPVEPPAPAETAQAPTSVDYDKMYPTGEVVEGTTNPPAATSSTSEPPEPQQVKTDEGLDKSVRTFIDKIYGTEGLSDDERRIRRRAMTEAFVEGLGFLTRGHADLTGVYDRRNAAYAQLSEQEQETMRAEGVAKMAENMGLGQIAGLAYMGEAARNSLTNAMVSSISAKGTGKDYDLDPESRQALVTRAEEMGRPELARMIANSTGKALEDAVTSTLDLELPTGEESDILPSAAPLAEFVASQGADPALVEAMRNATTAQEINSVFDQLGSQVDKPASQLEFEYLQSLPPDLAREYLEMKRAGAGGERPPEDLANVAVVEPIKADIKRFAEASYDIRSMANSARSQQLLLANPKNKPNSLKAAVEPVVRLLQPLAPEGFFDGALNDEELLSNRAIEAIKNSNLGNLASGVPGQLSNLEGEKLTQIMAGSKDRRVEGLALAQFIQRNAERQQAANDARAAYLRDVGAGKAELSTQAYEERLNQVAQEIPVFRELTAQEYRAELAAMEEQGYSNATLPLEVKSEVIMVRLPNGELDYRTFGFYEDVE